MTLYGFFWSDCICESGPVLVSIHRSKMGALRAGRRAVLAMAQGFTLMDSVRSKPATTEMTERWKPSLSVP